LSEVQSKADERIYEVFAGLISNQQDLLNDIPENFSSFADYTKWTLDLYTGAKKLEHNIKKHLSDQEYNPNVIPLRDGENLLAQAKQKVEICRNRYYRAVGRKTREFKEQVKEFLSGDIKVLEGKRQNNTSKNIMWDCIYNFSEFIKYETDDVAKFYKYSFEKGSWIQIDKPLVGTWSFLMIPNFAKKTVQKAMAFSPYKNFIVPWNEEASLIRFALFCSSAEIDYEMTPPKWFLD
jgi:hypothetical protein